MPGTWQGQPLDIKSVTVCLDWDKPGSILRSPALDTTSLAQWLRRPPQECKIQGSIPAYAGIFPGQVIPVTSSSSSAFDMMVALTRFFLLWVPHIWMSGANPLQTPRAWFWGTHKWAISAALLADGVSRTVGSVPVTSKLALQWLPCHRVSTGTGWPDVSTLWFGELESLICNFYLSVEAHKNV